MATEVASSMKATKPGFEESAENKSFPIRMTLSSTKVKAVEQGMFPMNLGSGPFACLLTTDAPFL